MKPVFRHSSFLLLFVSASLAGCVTSRVTPIAQAAGGQSVASRQSTDTPDLKIFLLERDIPPVIEQLGVVSFSINTNLALGVDSNVKQQLRKECQRLGANGAYRINDGTYYPLVVSYLVFRYQR